MDRWRAKQSRAALRRSSLLTDSRQWWNSHPLMRVTSTLKDTIQVALRRSSEAPAVTGISEAGEGWMIPGPGRRSGRNRLLARPDVVTRASQEREQQAYWAGKVMAILTEANAPVIVLASEAADPQGILVGAVGAAILDTWYLKAG